MAAAWYDHIVMVIPSIDGGHLLQRMLPTLRFRPSNVIVLDQGSTDDTTQICRNAGVELLQLGRPHTYTEACNIGAQIARERGYAYLCVSNNDIAFRTSVLSELMAEMERDARLGIVAPSQIIVDPVSGAEVLARRVYWKLNTVDFLHDLEDAPVPPRIEADFCELTCALIRMSAVKEIGFLDDAYGFYYEDADFCFRLRKAGYGAAYLPRSQIYHFISSTFSRKRQEQIDHLRRNRIYFAKKHLGYGVRGVEDCGCLAGESGLVARRLYPLLARFGMLDDRRPDLMIGRIGAATADYLLTTQRSPVFSKGWRGRRDRYRAVLATSEAVAQSLRSAGFVSFRVPLGIEPDDFNRWGPAVRRFDDTTYLAMADQHDPRPFAKLLQAWSRFTASGRRARLIVVGTRLARRMGRAADASYRSGRFEISCYAEERLELHETESPLADEELAHLYRSVDFTIIAAAESSSMTLLESLACGTPVVFDAASTSITALYHDTTGGVALPHAKTYEPRPADDTADSAGGLLAALERSEMLGAGDRSVLATAASYGVLSHSTLRHTAMAVRHALEMTQEREPDRLIQHLEQLAPELPLSIPDLVSPQPAAIPLRARLSGAMARRLTAIAAHAEEFGTAWQRNGLPFAVSRSVARARPRARHILPALVVRDPAARAISANPSAKKQTSPLLIGYIDAQVGIGQSLRGLATAMTTAGIGFSIYPLGVGVEGRRSIPFMQELYDEVTPHDVNIIEVSPAELPRVFDHVSENHFDGSYNILRTYWELANGPAVWRQNHGLDRIDEIWAPNAFCAAAFRDFFDGPIVIVPPCVEVADQLSGLPQSDRNRFGLDPDIFYFMFSFDYYSFQERKNPLAVIRAFQAAFPEFDCPVGLVVKATGAEGHFPLIKSTILAAAQADGRITIIDSSLSREDMLSLMASINCYVSLHRSEGFGLGMAEAMALTKPVIATDYSGNREFVTEQTGYPIPFTLIPVRPHEYVHTEGQVWADPDEDACAAAMRDIVDHPKEAASRSRAARAFVENRYSAANVGRLVTERLAAIRLSKPPKSTV